MIVKNDDIKPFAGRLDKPVELGVVEVLLSRGDFKTICRLSQVDKRFYEMVHHQSFQERAVVFQCTKKNQVQVAFAQLCKFQKALYLLDKVVPKNEGKVVETKLLKTMRYFIRESMLALDQLSDYEPEEYFKDDFLKNYLEKRIASRSPNMKVYAYQNSNDEQLVGYLKSECLVNKDLKSLVETVLSLVQDAKDPFNAESVFKWCLGPSKPAVQVKCWHILIALCFVVFAFIVGMMSQPAVFNINN